MSPPPPSQLLDPFPLLPPWGGRGRSWEREREKGGRRGKGWRSWEGGKEEGGVGGEREKGREKSEGMKGLGKRGGEKERREGEEALMCVCVQVLHSHDGLCVYMMV